MREIEADGGGRLLADGEGSGGACADIPTTRLAPCSAEPCPCEPQPWYYDGGCQAECGAGTRLQRRVLHGDCDANTVNKRETECVAAAPCACEDTRDLAALKAAAESSPSVDDSALLP